MRPLRLLLSLASCLVLLTLFLYLVLGATNGLDGSYKASRTSSKFDSFLSFTSPTSLFPPSAIISLTDDNSTFFLARPAAFGPLLPSKGLSGPLWIGSGFGDDAMAHGELGCSDVPGWEDGVKIARGTHAVAKHADIQSLQEGAEIAGKVVLLRRGGCGFLEKVNWAQRRGGVAVIVGDDVRGGALVRMYAHGDTSNVSIPSLFTSHTTAHLLSSLTPAGGILRDLAPEDAAKLKLIKHDKSGTGKTKGSSTKASPNRPTAQPNTPNIRSTAQHGKGTEPRGKVSWLRSLFKSFDTEHSPHVASTEDTRRPPSSGNLDWVRVDKWDEDTATPKATGTRINPSRKPTVAGHSDEFIIGEHDWRDPDLVAAYSTSSLRPTTTPKSITKDPLLSGNFPGSGEYDSSTGDREAWLKKWFSNKDSSKVDLLDGSPAPHSDQSQESYSTNGHGSHVPEHEGLWVTLTPTNVSSSPFFDTLLVLVVSPLVTLTVVYALLLVRSRIRRRRWRAPKSVVERLPVRTYQTINDSSTPPSATPPASSPTTPLLQNAPSRPVSSSSRPRSRTASDVPATSSSFQQSGRTHEEEKRETGLAEWRRRYGGRQKECVVCLEEYVDGVSRVMSLPCGHEFHVDCITPWLVTRRRTCPICKGDVVRSLSQSYQDRNQSPSPSRSSRIPHEDIDQIQAEAAETRNDSESASLPIPAHSASGSDHADDLYGDVEANWDDESDSRSRNADRRGQGNDLSDSLRDLSSSVSTTIWRGVDALRSAAGFTRRQPHDEDVDRDR